MNYIRPVLLPIFCGTFAMLVCAAPARAGDTHTFDKAMLPVLANYLKIQEALAADSTDGVQAAARSIATDAATLDTQSIIGEHAAQYADLPAVLQTSADALSKASSLDAAREEFKQLSERVATWGTMAKPAGVDILFCSMAKASWLQKHGETRNPYYGKSMLTCGEVVAGPGHSMDSTDSMKHQHHSGM
jgi:Cu(I)/Ag(I) efflux system membrane fusion protein